MKEASSAFLLAELRSVGVSKFQIDYAKKNLEAARGKVEELWTQVTETSDENREISGNLWVGVRELLELNFAMWRRNLLRYTYSKAKN